MNEYIFFLAIFTKHPPMCYLVIWKWPRELVVLGHFSTPLDSTVSNEQLLAHGDYDAFQPLVITSDCCINHNESHVVGWNDGLIRLKGGKVYVCFFFQRPLTTHLSYDNKLQCFAHFLLFAIHFPCCCCNSCLYSLIVTKEKQWMQNCSKQRWNKMLISNTETVLVYFKLVDL